MRIDRLFHVLVVNGGLLVAGCDDDDDGPTDEGASASAEDDGDTDDGGGSSDDASDASASTGDDAPELQCSEEPSPTDTCGCPCCWAADCINTDECCAGFSEACTPP